jgi:hypothetical protein
MRHLFKTAIVAFLVPSFAASAAPLCTPIPPTEWTAHVEVLHQAASSSAAYFETNDCDWGDLEELNGTDGLVLDVGGHLGPSDVTVMLGDRSLTHANTAGHFLDADCKRIEGSAFTAGTASDLDPIVNAVTIPEGARWMVFHATTSYGVVDVTVTVRTHGKDCPVKKPRKKR